jgi:hypothetical protein
MGIKLINISRVFFLIEPNSVLRDGDRFIYMLGDSVMLEEQVHTIKCRVVWSYYLEKESLTHNCLVYIYKPQAEFAYSIYERHLYHMDTPR